MERVPVLRREEGLLVSYGEARPSSGGFRPLFNHRLARTPRVRSLDRKVQRVEAVEHSRDSFRMNRLPERKLHRKS